MKKLLAVLSIALLVVGAVTIFSMAEDTAAPGPSAPTAPGANRLSLRRGERSGLLPEF